jgi:hypothetical protein
MFARSYAKFLVYVLFAAITALYDALNDGHVTSVEWVGLVIAGATAANVLLKQNSSVNTALKGAVAFAGTAAAFVATTIADGLSAQDWVQLLVLGVGAIMTYAVPNTGARVLTAA